MTTVEGQEVFILLEDGTLHKGIRLAGETEVRTFESDNLDTAGQRRESDEMPMTGVERLCQRCFGRQGSP